MGRFATYRSGPDLQATDLGDRGRFLEKVNELRVIINQRSVGSHRGVGQLLDTIADVQRLLNKDLTVLGLLPTMYDGRTTHARAILADLENRYGLPVMAPPIPKSIRFAEAPAVGRSVLATARGSKGAEAYREVAASIAASWR